MTISDPRVASASTPSLDALRIEIDRIDAALHGLLLDRGKIIDRLIAVKARQGGGSAFRPEREAEMMRRLVTRHSGILPLDTVESIWRIIIATFTYVQAPYSVHADVGAGDAAMRDSCRFHFGFTVPMVTHGDAAIAIAAVAEAGGDLGIIAASGPVSNAWWLALKDPAAPKIIARLPFVERADRAASLPLFVLAKPLAEAARSDIAVYAVEGAIARDPAIDVIFRNAANALVSAPCDVDIETVARLSGCRAMPVWVGSHARRFEVAIEASVAR